MILVEGLHILIRKYELFYQLTPILSRRCEGSISEYQVLERFLRGQIAKTIHLQICRGTLCEVHAL